MSFVRERKTESTNRPEIWKFSNETKPATWQCVPPEDSEEEKCILFLQRDKGTARRSIEDTCLLPRFTVQRFAPYVRCLARKHHLITYHQIVELPLCSSARWWTFPVEIGRCCFYIAKSLYIGVSSCKANGHLFWNALWILVRQQLKSKRTMQLSVYSSFFSFPSKIYGIQK